MSPSSFAASSITQGFPKSRSLLAGNYAYGGGATWLIERINVGSAGASSVTFSSIPQTFKHLQLRLFTRTSATGSESWQSMVFASSYNSGATGYTDHILYGTGTSAIATNELLANRINFGTTAGNGANTSVFGSGIIDILDYANTNKYKTVRLFDGYDNNGSGLIALRSGLWQSSTAISTITFAPENFGGVTYKQYSSFALYGVVG